MRDCGWITRIEGRVGERFHIGLAVVESDNGQFTFKTDFNSIHAFDIYQRFFTVIGQTAQVIPGTDNLTDLFAAQSGDANSDDTDSVTITNRLFMAIFLGLH